MSYLRVLYLTVPFCFIIGLWQGYKTERRDLSSQSRNQIVILSIKDSIPHEILNRYESRHPVVFIMEEVDSTEEIFDKLKKTPGRYDLITVNSHHIQHLPIELSDIARNSKFTIRGDFLSRSEKSIPLQWGVNGFLFKKDIIQGNPSSLAEIFDPKNKISILPETEELYSMMVRMGTISPMDSIVEKSHSIQNIFTSMSRFVSFSAPSSRQANAKSITQIHSGLAAKYLQADKNWRYVLPQERATFWVRSLVIPKSSSKKSATMRFIEYLFVPSITKIMVEKNWTASTNSQLDDLEVHPMLKPSWLRQISLRQLDRPTAKVEQIKALGYIVDSIANWGPTEP